MGSCPTCGGSERIPITPGFWRCTSEMARRVPVESVDQNIVLGPNAYGTRIDWVTEHEPCGAEYQEEMGIGMAPSPMACACGAFAIGTCSDCGKPVCGRHVSQWDPVLLCETCWQRTSDEAAAARVRQEQAAREQRRAVLASHHMEAIGRGESMSIPVAAQELVDVIVAELDARAWQGADTFTIGKRVFSSTKVRAIRLWGVKANWVDPDSRFRQRLCKMTYLTSTRDLLIVTSYTTGAADYALQEITDANLARVAGNLANAATKLGITVSLPWVLTGEASELADLEREPAP